MCTLIRQFDVRGELFDKSVLTLFFKELLLWKKNNLGTDRAGFFAARSGSGPVFSGPQACADDRRLNFDLLLNLSAELCQFSTNFSARGQIFELQANVDYGSPK